MSGDPRGEPDARCSGWSKDRADGPDACLVFDIGGTSLRAAIYEASGDKLSGVVRRPTPSHWEYPGRPASWIQGRLLRAMQELASSLLGRREPSVVSVAFPGPIGPEGEALSAPTVWGEATGGPFPVRRLLEGLWPASRVFVLNDVTAAGYRHLRDSHRDFCIATVSSGIGIKVFIDGRPVVGPAGRGGEIGHVRVDFSPDPPTCDCGGTGHLGAIASGRGALLLARRLAESDPYGFGRSLLSGAAGPLENADIAAAFRRGDDWARGLVRRVALPLGQMLAMIHAALGIERFILIGGFALALGEGYRTELIGAASGCCWQLGQDWDAMIALGKRDDLDGLLGAGRYAAITARGGR